jgi:transposase
VIFSLLAFVEGEMEAIRSEKDMNKRYELTDEQWQVIEPILPKRTATTGRKPKDPRQMLNGIVWVLRSGAPWRDVPERYGRWKTVYDYYWRGRDNGTFDRTNDPSMAASAWDYARDPTQVQPEEVKPSV